MNIFISIFLLLFTFIIVKIIKNTNFPFVIKLITIIGGFYPLVKTYQMITSDSSTILSWIMNLGFIIMMTVTYYYFLVLRFGYYQTKKKYPLVKSAIFGLVFSITIEVLHLLILLVGQNIIVIEEYFLALLIYSIGFLFLITISFIPSLKSRENIAEK